MKNMIKISHKFIWSNALFRILVLQGDHYRSGTNNNVIQLSRKEWRT